MKVFLINNLQAALVATIIFALIGIISFFTFEPRIGHSQASGNFVVTQTIQDEVSFNVPAANVNMSGSILGVSGGYATGTTIVSVNTNSPTGYNMTLEFYDNAAAHAMVASSTDPGSAYISDYTPATPGTPDYTWVDNSTGQAAEFGYTVLASTSSHIADLFKDNGASCDQSAGSQTADRCWMSPTTTPAATTIISSSAASPSSTTTIKFKVAVPSNPSPVLPSGVYTATGTLTATANP